MFHKLLAIMCVALLNIRRHLYYNSQISTKLNVFMSSLLQTKINCGRYQLKVSIEYVFERATQYEIKRHAEKLS